MSLNAHSADEEVTIKSLLYCDNIVPNASPTPSLVYLVLDISQLERQLILARQLQRLNVPTVLVVSKHDISQKEAAKFDLNALSELTQLPTYAISQDDKESVATLIKNTTPRLKEPTPTLSTIRNAIGDIVEDYKWAEKVATTAYTSGTKRDSFDLDSLLLHPILSPFIFFGIMWFFFSSIFYFAAPFMDLIDGSFASLMTLLNSVLPSSLVTEFLVDGLIGGIGAAVVFAPQVFILFIVIGLMEGSGYLARGAVIVDRPLSLVGLSGKSFVPLLSGCACAIPAMMAARTIPNKKERFITLFIIPLMSCSARLPVYALLLTLLFSNTSSAMAGLALTGIYATSIVIASIIAALLARSKGLQQTDTAFDIEVPRLHIPSIKNTVLSAWDNTYSFVKNAGPIIVVVAIALWLLGRFPSEDHSFIQIISEFIGPLWAPLGVDGRVGVALILSFAAREVFVSALAVMFSISEDNTDGLLQVLSDATVQGTSTPLFTTASIVSLILFFMISMQCMATLAVARKEMGNWKWPIVMTCLYIALAYLLASLAHYLLK
jgi:ferrous iron transport protein B